MWSSRPTRSVGLIAGSLALALLQACTVEPLNASRPLSSGPESNSVKAVLASTEVAPVNTREAQQVRNALMFAMHGGQIQPGGRYKVNLSVTKSIDLVSTQTIARSATSAQVQIKAGYTMIDKTNGSTVTSGTRTALASYDRTPQSFANQRAERDAVDRAAKDVAQQIRLTLGQTIAGL